MRVQILLQDNFIIFIKPDISILSQCFVHNKTQKWTIWKYLFDQLYLFSRVSGHYKPNYGHLPVNIRTMIFYQKIRMGQQYLFSFNIGLDKN